MNEFRLPEGVNPDDIKGLFKQLQEEDSVIRIRMNDIRLEKLAEYDATKGYTNMNVKPEEFQDRFQKFKGLVKRGTYTLKALEDNIYTQWGITEGLPQMNRKEFSVDDLDVADISEDSPENR